MGLFAPLRALCTRKKIMSKLRKSLQDTLAPEKYSSKKGFLEPKIILSSSSEILVPHRWGEFLLLT